MRELLKDQEKELLPDELEPEVDPEIPEADEETADEETADEDNSVSTQSMKDLDEDRAKGQDDISHLQTQLEMTREEKKLYQTTKKLKQEVEILFAEGGFFRTMTKRYCIILIEYVRITLEAICICQAITEAALISLSISIATCNANGIMFESLQVRSRVSI